MMKMRRTDHNESILDVVRCMLRGSPPTQPKSLDLKHIPVMVENVSSVLLEQMNGKRTNIKTKDCPYCGSSATMRVVIPRHGEDPISRCSACGKNNQPGDNAVRGSSNYMGGVHTHYDS